MVGLVWSNDPKQDAGDYVATCGQVKGNDPDKKQCPDPPGWVLVMGLNSQPTKSVVAEPQDVPWIRERNAA